MAAAVRAGYDDVRVYYLSFADWVQDESCPIVRNCPVILPMSGKVLKFITVGTRSMGAACGGATANSVSPAR
jgi:hypothetical protein